MLSVKPSVPHFLFHSAALSRDLVYDVYLPEGYRPDAEKPYSLVLFNDGQDLPKMHFEDILKRLSESANLPAFIVIGIRCSERRLREYGTASQPDYKGRGDLAGAYKRFVLEEFLPHIRDQFRISSAAKDRAYAGFSLGGLSALDIAWAHPEVFGAVGVFSGSLWWRSKAVQPAQPDADRIMIDIVQKTSRIDPAQRFWFQCGTLDETDDRNNNGVIDSIDDTLDLIKALHEKGVSRQNIHYLEIENGRHEVGTWGEAMPDFLGWFFGKK